MVADDVVVGPATAGVKQSRLCPLSAEGHSARLSDALAANWT